MNTYQTLIPLQFWRKRGGATVFRCYIFSLHSSFSKKGNPTTIITCSHSQLKEQEFNSSKSGKRKYRHIDDAYVSDSQLSTHNDHMLENSHASEDLLTPFKEHNKRPVRTRKWRSGFVEIKAQRNSRSTFSGFHSSNTTFIACNFMFYIYYWELIHSCQFSNNNNLQVTYARLYVGKKHSMGLLTTCLEPFHITYKTQEGFFRNSHKIRNS